MLTLTAVVVATGVIVLLAVVGWRSRRRDDPGPPTPEDAWNAIVAELASGRLARDPRIADNTPRREGPRPPGRSSGPPPPPSHEAG